ncbi:MAG: hypothetical protein KIT84_02300 [Labilithrix sp.]|nr:hypothetical protein [Labilithrix sp.]MCW5809816.1 hypothetical protein [Labilithrix sp.]
MSYGPPTGNQQQQQQEPVITCMGRALVAFDRDTGAVRWHFVAESAIQRLFRVGARVLASSGDAIVCVEVANGRHVGTVQIGFTPDAGLVCGTDLVLVDATSSGTETPCVVCVSSDGQIKWRGTTATGAQRTDSVLRTYGPDGTKRSEIVYAKAGYRAGILYGDVVAQPDRS